MISDKGGGDFLATKEHVAVPERVWDILNSEERHDRLKKIGIRDRFCYVSTSGSLPEAAKVFFICSKHSFFHLQDAKFGPCLDMVILEDQRVEMIRRAGQLAEVVQEVDGGLYLVPDDGVFYQVCLPRDHQCLG